MYRRYGLGYSRGIEVRRLALRVGELAEMLSGYVDALPVIELTKLDLSGDLLAALLAYDAEVRAVERAWQAAAGAD